LLTGGRAALYLDTASPRWRSATACLREALREGREALKNNADGGEAPCASLRFNV
jgi:hypothetical protein